MTLKENMSNKSLVSDIRNVTCPDFNGTVSILVQMSHCPACGDNVQTEDILSCMPVFQSFSKKSLGVAHPRPQWEVDTTSHKPPCRLWQLGRVAPRFSVPLSSDSKLTCLHSPPALEYVSTCKRRQGNNRQMVLVYE